MRLAYLGVDKTTLKTFNVIQNFYQNVDYYLADEVSDCLDLNAEILPLLVDNVCIPANVELHTSKQKAILRKIKKNHQLFFSSLYSANIDDSSVLDFNESASFNQLKISDISFIKFNRVINKFTIENSNKELIEYDFVLIQNNQFIMNAIADKQQNLFHSFAEQTHCIKTFVFNLSQRHKTSQKNDNFVFIENSLMNTLEDNWYIMQLSEKELFVSFLFPLEMELSQDYLNFLIDRVQSLINNSFISFKAESFVKSFSVPVDGYFTHKVKLRNSKNGALVPTFTFWADDKVQSHLKQVLKNKVIVKGKSELKN